MKVLEMSPGRDIWRCHRGGIFGDVTGEGYLEMSPGRDIWRCHRGGIFGDVTGEGYFKTPQVVMSSKRRI